MSAQFWSSLLAILAHILTKRFSNFNVNVSAGIYNESAVFNGIVKIQKTREMVTPITADYRDTMTH